MALRDEIVEVLRARGPLDDDQLADLLDRNRHYVNQVCRELAQQGRARRFEGPEGKLVTALTEDGAASSAEPRRPRRPKWSSRAERNTEALIGRFDECVRYFEAAEAFPAPSLYFHERAIERRRRAGSVDELLDDVRFLEYVYAMLPAWGMHRRGTATMVGDLGDLRASLDRHREDLVPLWGWTLTAIAEGERLRLGEALWDIIADLEVSTSRTKIVGGSKVLHHVLPDLMPPIDRRHTFQSFTGWGELVTGSRPSTCGFHCLPRSEHAARRHQADPRARRVHGHR